MAKVPWRVRGEEASGCNCAWGCPCQFNALPTHGRCEGIVTARIGEGRFGTVQLDNVRFAAAFSFPGAVHEGNGTFQLILDERSSAEQREAIIAMTGGAHGGAIFEIFGAVAPNRPSPLVVPIEIDADRERRTAKVSLPGVAEYRAEPIKNPVTGEEHRAQIRLPNGFEYHEAEMGNSAWLKVSAGPIVFEHRNSYAQFNAFDWSNEPA
jgi:hypothetical protein